MNRLLVVGVCTLVGLTAGTLYLFSAYGPQLGSRLEYTGTETSLIAFVGSMGVALSGVPGGFVVDRLLALAQGIGGLCIGVGYLGLRAQFNASYGNVACSALLSCLIGVGSTLVNSSMIKCAALCFPQHRGLATSFPISSYGLSAFAYSLAGHWMFGADTSKLLAMLGYSAFLICLVGLPVVYYAEKLVDIAPPSYEMVSFDQEHPQKQINDDMTRTEVLKSSRFWILLSTLGILAGLGQLYIYSCGFMIQSLLLPAADHATINRAQSFQVSLLSICNCLARLMCGACGDFISNRLGHPRSWIVLIPCLVLLAVQVMCYSISDYNTLWLGSALNGVGYGFAWSSIPQILIEFFGVKHFSFSWGFIQLGTLLPTFFFTHVFGLIYDSNSTTDTETGTARLCLLGNRCYNRTFLLSSAFSLLSIILAVYINVRPYYKGLRHHPLA